MNYNPYKVGDRVRVNLDAGRRKDPCRVYFISDMRECRGKEYTVKEVSDYAVKLEGCGYWNFDLSWITPVEEGPETVVSEDEFEKLFDE